MREKFVSVLDPIMRVRGKYADAFQHIRELTISMGLAGLMHICQWIRLSDLAKAERNNGEDSEEPHGSVLYGPFVSI